MKKYLYIITLALLIFIRSATLVYAENNDSLFLVQAGGQTPAQQPARPGAQQTPGTGQQGIQVLGQNIPAVTPISDLLEAFNRVIRLIFELVGVIAFLYLIYAGFQYLTAGSSDAAENAKKTIINAIIGILIFFLSLAIVTFVINALGSGRVW